MAEIKLTDNEKLYPLYSQDIDGKNYLSTWIEPEKMRWFYAIVVGDIFTRPYWDAVWPAEHKIVAIFDNKDEAQKYMLANLQPNIYLNAGWVIDKNTVTG